MIEFPDISFYQGDVDWQVMNSKTNNIIIRAGQANYSDSKFKANWANAKASGMKRGCYWFYDDRYSPTVQADAWAQQIASDRPETVAWLDWENSYSGAYTGLSNVVACMQRLEALLPGIVVGMYTGYYWFRDNTLSYTGSPQYSYLATKPLWVAAYTATGSSEGILIPAPWTYPPELHQWGTPPIGLTYGVQSQEIDMNRVLNNSFRYEDNSGGPTMDPINPPQRYKVTANTLNIRNSPGVITTASDIGDLPINTLCTVDGSELIGTTRWFHLIDAIKPDGSPVITTSGQKVSERSDCWASGTFMVYYDTPVQPTDPKPPQEVLVTDESGAVWKCTTFTRMP